MISPSLHGISSDAIPQKQVVFQQGDGGGTGRTWLFTHQDAGEIRSFLGNGTTTSGINAEAEQWYHTAVVVTEGGGVDSVQLYVDGEIAGAPFAAGMEDSEGIFFIGCHKDIIDLMDGIIDELVLVNKALSEAEIRDLMNNGLASVMAVEPTGKLAVSWGEIKSGK
ncbi:LamG-like jellyroll fold domain-containing protein [Candidatus Poribacteria bacterium]